MPLTPVIGSIYFLPIPLSTEPATWPSAMLSWFHRSVLSLSWKTARSLDFGKLFPFFPLSFFQAIPRNDDRWNLLWPRNAPMAFQWFARLFRTIERLYLTMCLRIHPLSCSFIGMVIPRGGSKRVEIHPAGGRERERATRSIFKGLGAIWESLRLEKNRLGPS